MSHPHDVAGVLRFFHTFGPDGDLVHQGVVHRFTRNGLALVSYFSWIDGHSLGAEYVNLGLFPEVRFYRTDEEMRSGYYDHVGMRYQDRMWSESFVEFTRTGSMAAFQQKRLSS